MTAIDTGTTRSRGETRPARRPRLRPVEIVVGLLVVAMILRGWLAAAFSPAPAAAAASVFVSVLLQALPFLLGGALLAAAARALFAPHFLLRWLRARGVLDRRLVGVPAAALAAIVPCGRDENPELIREGVPPGAVFAYQLAGSALSPVVIVATAVVFPGEPLFLVARVVAGLLLAVVVGWAWQRFGRPGWLEVGTAPASRPEPDFWTDARLRVVRAGGVLAVGAFATALLTVAAPAGWTRIVAERSVFSVIALALLAVLVCAPAEAGPAVAAALPGFSPTARLVFLVAGPAVNLLRFSQQSYVYGPAFAVRFAPATLVAAVGTVAAVAWML